MKIKIHTDQSLIGASPSDACYKKMYGQEVLISRIGSINIIHLDKPSPGLIQQRIAETIQEEITGKAAHDDCPLCRQFENSPYDIVYLGGNSDSHQK